MYIIYFYLFLIIFNYFINLCLIYIVNKEHSANITENGEKHKFTKKNVDMDINADTDINVNTNNKNQTLSAKKK